jgi:DNA polymerase III gamma/tau subunit
MTEQEILRELVSILDRLNELPRDAIRERVALLDRQQDLRKSLAAMQANDLEALNKEWDSQAGAKAPQEDEGDVSGTIPSPLGGSGAI